MKAPLVKVDRVKMVTIAAAMNFVIREPAAIRLPLPGSGNRPAGVSWRFRVPEGEAITFDDLFFGRRSSSQAATPAPLLLSASLR